MQDADALLRSGDVAGTRRVLVDAVRARPDDAPARMFLFQLLALTREWDKAKTHLATLARLSPEAQMLGVVYAQAIDAEIEREAVFAGRTLATVHGGGDQGAAWTAGVAEALRLDALGDADAAEAARTAAFDAAPDTPGTLDGTALDWIADADPRFGPTVEAVIGGRYGLLPFAAIERLVSEGPRDLRDLVWYPAELTLRTGARIAALLPARYPVAAGAEADPLSRETVFTDDGHGTGPHLWVTSDGSDHALAGVRDLRFA